jgi:hypothetical protein
MLGFGKDKAPKKIPLRVFETTLSAALAEAEAAHAHRGGLINVLEGHVAALKRKQATSYSFAPRMYDGYGKPIQ